jgi:hypothetical protein
MNFREHSIKDGWSDWQLARLAVDIHRMERYGGTLQAEVEPRMRAEFTADEVRRVDAYLAASLPDTGRLTAIDRIDNGGSLINNGHISSAIGYIRNTRDNDA